MQQDRQMLIDILVAIQQILRYAQNIEQKQLEQDDEKQAAILYRLIIIGEATKRLSTHSRELYSSIPWREMAGLRDVLTYSPT